MEKYVTSIKDLIYNVMKNRIAEDDGATTNFQLGIVHLLGINTSVDFVRAGQFFSNSSLKNIFSKSMQRKRSLTKIVQEVQFAIGNKRTDNNIIKRL